MSTYSNSHGSKPASAGRDNKKPHKDAPKGAQREGHRGYRADAASAAPKKRWTQDDRAARIGDRPSNSVRPAPISPAIPSTSPFRTERFTSFRRHCRT